MEDGIRDALLAILREHKIINVSEHGFMVAKSTTIHSLECNFDWNTAIKSGHRVDIVYLDL